MRPDLVEDASTSSAPTTSTIVEYPSALRAVFRKRCINSACRVSKSPMRTPLRSNPSIHAGRLDQFDRNGESNAKIATDRWSEDRALMNSLAACIGSDSSASPTLTASIVADSGTASVAIVFASRARGRGRRQLRRVGNTSGQSGGRHYCASYRSKNRWRHTCAAHSQCRGLSLPVCRRY